MNSGIKTNPKKRFFSSPYLCAGQINARVRSVGTLLITPLTNISIRRGGGKEPFLICPPTLVMILLFVKRQLEKNFSVYT